MLKIEAIAAFNDNYIWLFRDTNTRAAWVVDPGDAAPVMKTLQEKDLQLAGILITHHHSDHVGGVAQLRAHYDVPVYGPSNTPASGITQPLREGEHINAAGCEFGVIEIPGHTLDHIAYFCAAPVGHVPFVFCGDTLFAGGCGRVFEGTLPMMYASLQKIAQLPAATQIYCAHEYTLSNLKFALAVEPNNKNLQQRQNVDQEKRKRSEATVPSTLDIELATNPFLRCEEPLVRHAAERFCGRHPQSNADTFAVLRGWKDNF
jgi:hydroxyacylglutathione hydrolase